MKIAGISSKKFGDPNEGMLDNKNLYNDKELFDDADLDWYDYGFRNYDPQIGRFPQLDPLTDDYPELTNYQYASNDPILNIDLDGLEGVPTPGGIWNGSFLEQGTELAGNGSATLFRTIATQSVKLTSNVAEHKVENALITKALEGGLKNRVKKFLIKHGHSLLKKTALTIYFTLTLVETGKELTPKEAYERLGYTSKKPEEEDDENEDIYLYRGGPFTDVNFTPKESDTKPGPKQGWSTFIDPLRATQGQGGKYQVLSAKLLLKFGFLLNVTNDGHVGVVPKSQRALNAWAATKEPLKAGRRGAHLLTRILKKTRIKEGRIL